MIQIMAAAASSKQLPRGTPVDLSPALCCPGATTIARRGAAAQWKSAAGHRRGAIRVRSAASSSTVDDEVLVEYEKGREDRARWAGDDPLARAVTALISIKPLFKIMTFFAMKVMVRTGEKTGVPWWEMLKEMKESDVYAEKDRLENVNISYPEYYTIGGLHSYDKGDLCWEAAFDSEPETKVVMVRALSSRHLSVEEAEKIARFRWLKEIDSHHTKYSNGLPVSVILDVGCSTGNSTRHLRGHFQTAQLIGLDLSPYHLAVAQQIQKRDSPSIERKILWLHANGEETGLPSESFDIISYAFVLHECPQSVTRNLLKEARRLLKPGGTVAFVDTSPKSKVIQELPPALFVLLKATEPYLDEYFLLDLEGELAKNGFTYIRSTLTSPRHATVTATSL